MHQTKETLRAQASAFEAELFTGDGAADIVLESAAIEQSAGAIKTLALLRVDETGYWKREGYGSCAKWLAHKTGVSLGDAISSVDTARRLKSLPATEEAMRSGQLSQTQSATVTKAASAAPQFEAQLLASAQANTVKGLKKEAAQIESAVSSREQQDADYENLRRTRYVRFWKPVPGVLEFRGRLVGPEAAMWESALKWGTRRRFEQARKAGVRDDYDRYQADAMVDLMTSSGNEWKPNVTVDVKVDLEALRRREKHAGEVAAIQGLGPVPVSVIEEMLSDAKVRVLFEQDGELKDLVTVGRKTKKKLKDAVKARDEKCSVEHCDNDVYLEIDHTLEVASGGVDSVDNLARLCRPHHYQKTYKGFTLGDGPPGRRKWIPPAS